MAFISGRAGGDIVKIYYMHLAEPMVESINVTISKTEEAVSKAVVGRG